MRGPTEKILQMTLRNDQSCLSQFECPQMRCVPRAVIVNGQRNPVRHPGRRPDAEAIQTAVTRNVRISTVDFQALGRNK